MNACLPSFRQTLNNARQGWSDLNSGAVINRLQVGPFADRLLLAVVLFGLVPVVAFGQVAVTAPYQQRQIRDSKGFM